MTRLAWFLGGSIAAVAGWDLAIRAVVGEWPWLLTGIGIGIDCAVLGSLVHDALAGPRERL